ncbi:hypothetical protein VPH35_000709 [Triticum aestivum]|uniref:GDSL esterase/lipase n=1 Tax=Triticum urartu TaxID=4572 RepID=A0A8R7NY86_TRIUA
MLQTDRGPRSSMSAAAAGDSAPRRILALALAVALALWPSPARAGFSCSPGARPVVFNFGDSNSDTGGMAAAKGWHIAPPEGRAFFHHPTGRFCDGRLVIDFLCESLNISYLSPYLKAIGSNYSNGVNFAISGSTTLPRDALFVLHGQVQEFFFFKARSLELINQGQEAPIDAEAFLNALYIIDIGQNDINALLSNLPYDQVVAKLPPILAEIKYAVQVKFSFLPLVSKLLYAAMTDNHNSAFFKNCSFCMAMGVGTSGYMEQGLLVACLRSSLSHVKTTVTLIRMAASAHTTEPRSRSTQL